MLGAQPPPPGTTPLRYANVKAKEQELELVPEYTYYYKDDQPLIDLSPRIDVEKQSAQSFFDLRINQLMYVANQGNRTYNQPTQQQRSGQTPQQRPYQQQARKLECFRCGDNHFVRECPFDKPPKPSHWHRTTIFNSIAIL